MISKISIIAGFFRENKKLHSKEETVYYLTQLNLLTQLDLSYVVKKMQTLCIDLTKIII